MPTQNPLFAYVLVVPIAMDLVMSRAGFLLGLVEVWKPVALVGFVALVGMCAGLALGGRSSGRSHGAPPPRPEPRRPVVAAS